MWRFLAIFISIFVCSAYSQEVVTLSGANSSITVTINKANNSFSWVSSCVAAGHNRGCAEVYTGPNKDASSGNTCIMSVSCDNIFKGQRNGSSSLPAAGNYIVLWVADYIDNQGIFSGVQWDSYEVTAMQQACTLNIFNASMTAGGSVNFTMSGAKAGNKYNVTVLAGQGGVNYDNTTGQGLIISTGTGNGQIDLKAWISEGGGYARSLDVYGSVQVYPPEAMKNIILTIPAGDGIHAVTYVLKQDGKILSSYEQPAGGGAIIQQYKIPTSGGAVTMESIVHGVIYDGVSVINTADGTGSISKVHNIVGNPLLLPSGDGVQIVVPNATQQVTTDPATSVTQAASPSAPSSSPDPKKNTAPVVWSAGGGSQTDLVTNTVFREGVGKQVQALADFADKVVGKEFKPTVPVERALPESEANYTGAQIDAEVAKLLPAVPSLPSSVGTANSMEISFGNMGGILPNVIKFDLGFGPGSSSAVSYIRAVELFVLGVFFFFAVVRLIRQTFAG